VLPEVKGPGLFEVLDEVYQSGNSSIQNEILAKLDSQGEGKLTEHTLV
jgi:hypothetical protein